MSLTAPGAPAMLSDEGKREMLTAAKMLLQNAEICATKHQAASYAQIHKPGWLSDCRKAVNEFAAALSVRASASPDIEKMLGELDALHAKATPGEWTEKILPNSERGIYAAGHGFVAIIRCGGSNPDANEQQIANYAFIVAFRKAYPALRSAIDALTARANEAEARCDAMREALKPFVEAGSALADSIYPGVTKAKILVDIADIGQARAAIAQGEPR